MIELDRIAKMAAYNSYCDQNTKLGLWNLLLKKIQQLQLLVWMEWVQKCIKLTNIPSIRCNLSFCNIKMLKNQKNQNEAKILCLQSATFLHQNLAAFLNMDERTKN